MPKTAVPMSTILLSTLNARYIHTAFGLRYLKANLGELADQCEILEFTIHERPIDVAEQLLKRQSQIIGLGVYIWNIEEMSKLVGVIKQVSPETIVVLGGPEVSYEQEAQPICQMADYVIAGQGDMAFAELCRQLLKGQKPLNKFSAVQTAPLELIQSPYHLYNEDDVAHRIIYVEASRGCPFKCEFCLSALDKTAKPFALDIFLEDMDALYQRGVRHFKFVDRTFNLKIDASIRIMEFFLARMDEHLFLHFELIPDHLPEKLKSVIARFPENSLQFEIGVQSFNAETQTLISRRQDDAKTEQNLRWIREQTNAHIHADLIIGLPGEDLNSFAAGLNRLVALNPHEIQVGILKRLRGSPLIRHTDEFQLRFSPAPPYNILSTREIDFVTMQRLSRFARYWDMIINSGRFSHSKALLFANDPFARFMALADWLFEQTGQTHKINLKRLFELLFSAMTTVLGENVDAIVEGLLIDYQHSGLKGLAPFLKNKEISHKTMQTPALQRQQRHR